ncbi:MAG TPA: alpha/beta fold hydrolase [Chthoniobacterales bacterium]|jgi:pimeloyl-ACP methyl ester carboxylesterase|nr:alpha/beta fold hydrolase [Chthoniobacterales bacterium]
MNIAGRRSIGLAILLVLLAGASCHRPKRASAELSGTPTPHGIRAPITAHAPDAFYDPPSDLRHQPGALVRNEPLKDVILPAGMRGWRILYATTVDDSTPATAVATVFAPTDSPAGPRPVVAWEHATTGLLQKCMPSLLSAPTAGIPARDRIVMAGWVVVETDYSFTEKGGPHPYLIGEGEARATLDAVRAARQMSELTLDKRVVVWGHSQGGHAALWTGIVAPRYAPDIEILGVVAIAPAANIRNILELDVAVDKRFGAYLARSYSRFYPDITFEQAIRPEALDAARQIVNLCDFLPPEDSERIESLAATFDGPALATSSNKALQARIEQNTADGLINAPVVIAQGLSDNVVPPAATDVYVEERCAAGQRLEYWTFAGRDHFTIDQPGAPLEELLVTWTMARFANEPQASGCVHKSF